MSIKGTKLWLLHVGNMVADEAFFITGVRWSTSHATFDTDQQIRPVRPQPANPTQRMLGVL